MILPARLLVMLVLLLVAAGAGYWAGDRQRDNAWKADQGELLRKAHAAYAAEVTRGTEAAQRYLTDLQDKDDRYEELKTRFAQLRKRVGLLVAPVAAGDQAGQAQTEQCINCPVRHELSLGAVWMWNSALAGANVPAGACGTDEAPWQACAAGSGLTEDDAWDNHVINAKSCADDRLRLNELIDYLEGRRP